MKIMTIEDSTIRSLKQQQRIAAAMIECGIAYTLVRKVIWYHNGTRIENFLKWNASWCCRRSFKIIKQAKEEEPK